MKVDGAPDLGVGDLGVHAGDDHLDIVVGKNEPLLFAMACTQSRHAENVDPCPHRVLMPQGSGHGLPGDQDLGGGNLHAHPGHLGRRAPRGVRVELLVTSRKGTGRLRRKAMNSGPGGGSGSLPR